MLRKNVFVDVGDHIGVMAGKQTRHTSGRARYYCGFSKRGAENIAGKALCPGTPSLRTPDMEAANGRSHIAQRNFALHYRSVCCKNGGAA